MSIILDGSTGITSDSSASNPAMTAKGNGSDVEGYIQLNCRVNSHGVKLKSPPHSSGQSYTMVLPDNQVAADKFLKVKSITGSGATAVGQLEYADPGGITMADMFMLNATHTISTSGAYITANWARPDSSDGFAKIGTGLTESSGQFSFPETGLYLIEWNGLFTRHASGGVRYVEHRIDVSFNSGNNYQEAARGRGTTSAIYYVGNNHARHMFNVTNASTHRFYIREYSYNDTVISLGSSTSVQSHVMVTRLGDAI